MCHLGCCINFWLSSTEYSPLQKKKYSTVGLLSNIFFLPSSSLTSLPHWSLLLFLFVFTDTFAFSKTVFLIHLTQMGEIINKCNNICCFLYKLSSIQGPQKNRCFWEEKWVRIWGLYVGILKCCAQRSVTLDDTQRTVCSAGDRPGLTVFKVI